MLYRGDIKVVAMQNFVLLGVSRGGEMMEKRIESFGSLELK